MVFTATSRLATASKMTRIAELTAGICIASDAGSVPVIYCTISSRSCEVGRANDMSVMWKGTILMAQESHALRVYGRGQNWTKAENIGHLHRPKISNSVISRTTLSAPVPSQERKFSTTPRPGGYMVAFHPKVAMLDHFKRFIRYAWLWFRSQTLFVQALIAVPFFCGLLLTLLVGNMGLAFLGGAIALGSWTVGIVAGLIGVVFAKASAIIIRDRNR